MPPQSFATNEAKHFIFHTHTNSHKKAQQHQINIITFYDIEFAFLYHCQWQKRNAFITFFSPGLAKYLFCKFKAKMYTFTFTYMCLCLCVCVCDRIMVVSSFPLINCLHSTLICRFCLVFATVFFAAVVARTCCALFSFCGHLLLNTEEGKWMKWASVGFCCFFFGFCFIWSLKKHLQWFRWSHFRKWIGRATFAARSDCSLLTNNNN